MRTLVFGSAYAILVAGLVAAPAPGHALTCMRYRAEVFQLKLLEVRRGKTRVPTVARLVPFVTLRSAHRKDNKILLGYSRWPNRGKRGTSSKFFTRTKAIAPTPKVRQRLRTLATWRQRTLCGFYIPYAPIRPGVYKFFRDLAKLGKTPRDLRNPILTVPANRKRVQLSFGYRGQRYVATYRVVKDLTRPVTRLTLQQRRRGLCLRGFRQHCRKRRGGRRRR